MKNYRYLLICLFLLGSGFLVSPALGQDEEGVDTRLKELTGEKETKFSNLLFVPSRNTLYNIYYEASGYDAVWLESVRIAGTTKIEGQTFLVIWRSDAVDRKGYVLFDSVKAILPSDIKPKTLSDVRLK